MNDYTIQEFCDKHNACLNGRVWALSNCNTMQEAWDKCTSEHAIWIATRDGVLTDKELRLFAVFCARQNQHLLTDERSINAIDVAERHANGIASDDDLCAAWAAADAAWAAARAAADVARAAAWAAAWSAADAASAAARAAADVARAAARAAASAASDAASAAARAAARAAQSRYLREKTKPNFSKALAAVKGGSDE